MRLVQLCRSVSVALLLGLAACAGDFDTYRQTIGEFQGATARTSAATQGFLLELNDFERTVEFARLRYDADRVLDLERLESEPFSPEAIQVRVEAFRIIESYTDALAALAGDAPEQEWRQASATLGERAGTLLTRVKGLTGSALEGVPDIGGPLERLLAFGGSQFLKVRRSRALDAAIEQASPAIEQLSQLLQADVRTALRLRETGLDERLSAAVLTYRRVQVEGPPTDASDVKRQYILDHLERALAQREALTAEAGAILATMARFDEAHGALVAYARSDKSDQELSELIATVKSYGAEAVALYRSVAAVGAAG